ncbi:hypothetical protein S40293_11159 [Stachybotrys chartarum IBT 40293]|nr:hypothetical protein S40293_11159 [Stachybotrys chartarum IBT 40293]
MLWIILDTTSVIVAAVVVAAVAVGSRNSKTLCGPPDESVGSVYPVLRTDPALGHSSTAFPGIERICLALIGVASVWTGTWPLRTAPKKCDEVKSARLGIVASRDMDVDPQRQATATADDDGDDGQRRRRSLILGYEADARTENACDEERGSHSIRLELASLTLASRATYCGLTPPVTLYNGDAAWIGSGLKSQSCVRIAANLTDLVGQCYASLFRTMAEGSNRGGSVGKSLGPAALGAPTLIHTTFFTTPTTLHRTGRVGRGRD